MKTRKKLKLAPEEEKELLQVTPSWQLCALHGQNLVLSVSQGKPYFYYDLASLTKPIVTVTLCMKLVAEGKIRLSDPLVQYLPWFRSKLPIRCFLSHQAGMLWWAPLYKRIQLERNLHYRKAQLMHFLREQRPPLRGGRARYSDLDFWLLGLLIEAVEKKPLEVIWREFCSEQGLEGLFFHSNNQPLHSRHEYAPTEKCPWRRKRLRGEVHDDNAWALGGVAGHAGLFGSMQGVVAWAQKFRATLQHEDEGFFWPQNPEIKHFWRRATAKNQEDWALGFMMPSGKKASCGRHFSSQAIGHLGFTGTSWWYDPHKDWTVILLAHRVYYGREPNTFRIWRPLLHDRAYETVFE